MSGISATHILRENNFTGLMFGCTGNSLQDDQQKFIKAGVNLVLIKPIQPKELAEHIITRHAHILLQDQVEIHVQPDDSD